MSTTTHAQLVGVEVQLSETYRPVFLAGARVVVLRQSGRTGSLTVAMRERRGAYEVGSEICVGVSEVVQLGRFRVMCRVSGGVTGTRGPSPLKLHGIEQRYESRELASRAALEAKAAVSPHAVALFEYWPEEVPAS